MTCQIVSLKKIKSYNIFTNKQSLLDIPVLKFKRGIYLWQLIRNSDKLFLIHIVEVKPCYEKIFVKNGQCSTTGEFNYSLLFVSDFDLNLLYNDLHLIGA